MARIKSARIDYLSRFAFRPSIQMQQMAALEPLRRRSSILAYTTRNSIQESRLYSTQVGAHAAAVEPPDYLDDKERGIFQQLNDKLHPTELEVQDISHGCGSMYAVAITSDRFKGLSVVKQHRMVNEILKERIKDWHGMQLKTKAP